MARGPRNLEVVLGDLRLARAEKAEQRKRIAELHETKGDWNAAAYADARKCLDNEIADIDVQEASKRIAELMNERCRALRRERYGCRNGS